MSDDAPRPLTEEEVPRLFAARSKGGMCARCGRALTATEPIWVETLDVVDAGRHMGPYRAPVGAECASAAFREATAGIEPEPCVTCGRGVYYRTADPRRRLVTCSRRCAASAARARVKEAKGS